MANEHRTTEVMRVCTERVYSDNPFHLLGLRTTATPRQIRRRHEDLDAAREMGDAAWRAEFGYLLGTREVPTSEEVEEAFARLGDAESRLLAEFFWMWPMQGQDVAIEALVAGEKTVAFDLWERAALGFGRARLAARHNLAVVYHLYAIDAEVQAIAAAEPIPEDFSRTMLSYWDQAFRHWEALADDDAFWELFEARMRAFDDPRLTGGFVRRLRRDFPVAFDNINARLAVRYAEAGRFDEARRHIDAMRRTMSGLDDVAQNLSLIFAPVEKRLSMLTAQYEARIAKDPLEGKACFQELLAQADAFTRLATGLLDKGDPIRLRILSTIFNAANRYLIAYGNKTETWSECLAFNAKLAPFVCTEKLRTIYSKNTGTLERNAKEEAERNTCWKCKRTSAEVGPMRMHNVSMYGNLKPTITLSPFDRKGVTFSKRIISIPLCKHCHWLWPWEKRAYPEVRKMLQQGWRFGESPSDEEIRAAQPGCMSTIVFLLAFGTFIGYVLA